MCDALNDVAKLSEKLEKEEIAKEELQEKLKHAAEETREWKARYTNDMAAKADELEDVRYLVNINDVYKY